MTIKQENMTYNIIRELLHKSDASGSRSTILKPLTWFISLVIGGIILLIKIDSPNWIVIMFSIIMAFSIFVFFFAYVYCLFTDKDAIRSEKYSIQKLAIEKGLYGDSTSGIILDNNRKPLNESLEIKNSEEGE
jgi:Na+/pantothenate symporter